MSSEEVNVGLPDKMTVFQRCVSSFNASALPAQEARDLLTQLVHLFYLGETFPEAEATQLFFTITKLFQKENTGLKQMVYLAIKELVPFTDNVIMGTSVLMRDVQQAQANPRTAQYRPQALRALCRILDAGAVEGMDRLMRSVIVDRDEACSSAALVSAYHLIGIAKETVRRWTTEVQEVLAQTSGSVSQYHALGLLYHMRSHDRMALIKLIKQYGSQGVLRNPNAIVLLLRYTGQLLSELPKDDAQRPALLEILQSNVRTRFELVNLEACKLVLSGIVTQETRLQEAILVLQMYLGSPRTTSRFSAIRILNRYATVNPTLVAQCNAEIEQLISDSNLSVATYAITTLLKTGSESSVDKLIDQISSFMGDIPDDFRVTVVDAIRSLAKRFPAKHDRMLSFFAESLREESGLPLKTAIVEAISDVLHTDSASESYDSALLLLCDTIADCEFVEITIAVLHLLGKAGPRSPSPSTLVRHIYNRMILDNSHVRAAAISALSKFIGVVPDAEKLIARGLRDVNDEVRDRAATVQIAEVTQLPDEKLAMGQLEQSLIAYLEDPSAFSKEFDASRITRISDEDRTRTRVVIEISADEPERAQSKESTTPKSKEGPDYASILNAIPEIAALGKLLQSSPRESKLTDTEMEYVVSAVTHVFPSHVVLQYNVLNNFELDLAQLSVEVDLSDLSEEDAAVSFVIPVEQLAPQEQGSVFVAVERTGVLTGEVPSKLKFIVDGEEDEYPTDDFELRPSDYLHPTYVGSFDHQWDELIAEEVFTRQFTDYKSLDDVAEYLDTQLGLMALDGTDKIESHASTHVIKLFGRTYDDVPVAVMARLVRSTRSGMAGKITIRSADADIAAIIANAI